MPLSAEDVKKELISTLMTEAKGMTARQLYGKRMKSGIHYLLVGLCSNSLYLNEWLCNYCVGNFRELVGEVIPFAKFGFSSIENYMRSFPDVVRISRYFNLHEL